MFGLSHCKQYTYIFDFNTSDTPGMVETSPPLITGFTPHPSTSCFLFHVPSMPRSLSILPSNYHETSACVRAGQNSKCFFVNSVMKRYLSSLTLLQFHSTHRKRHAIGWMLGSDHFDHATGKISIQKQSEIAWENHHTQKKPTPVWRECGSPCFSLSHLSVCRVWQDLKESLYIWLMSSSNFSTLGLLEVRVT